MWSLIPILISKIGDFQLPPKSDSLFIQLMLKHVSTRFRVKYFPYRALTSIYYLCLTDYYYLICHHSSENILKEKIMAWNIQYIFLKNLQFDVIFFTNCIIHVSYAAIFPEYIFTNRAERFSTSILDFAIWWKQLDLLKIISHYLLKIQFMIIYNL